MSETTFQTVFRGYDPATVEHVIHTLKAGQAAALQEAAQKTAEISKLQANNETLAAELADMRSKIEKLEQETSNAKPTYADLGARVAQILKLAEEEAKELVDKARAEADQHTAESKKTADEIRVSAEAFMADRTSKAEVEASKIVESAKRDADELIDHAEREASARRGEAEAIYESQREKAAAAAADFERTLAVRRDKAAGEFQALINSHETALKVAEEKLAQVKGESSQVLDGARAEAKQLREAAKKESEQMVEDARANAERIRRDSERELAALASRRDSITGQLANVRQMLATLGGASLDAAAFAADAELSDANLAEQQEKLAEAAAEIAEVEGDVKKNTKKK